MAKTRILALALAAALLLTLSLSGAALAQNVPPSVFAGMAMVDGEQAMDGAMVVAMAGEEKVGEAEVMDGRYTLKASKPMDESGTTLTFMIGDKSAEQTRAPPAPAGLR